jgi:hypothetical protein
MATAGRILIIPKGNYDASATYEMLDLVNHNGISWIAKKTSVGITPSEGEYWQALLGISIANDLTTTEEGKVLDARQGKAIVDLLGTKKTRVLLWSGEGVSDGRIDCTGQDNYTEFEILCNDGCILQGYKVYNEADSRYQIQCGYCGVIGMGQGKYGHGSYAGLIDVYNTHFYVQGISMHVIPTGEYYEGKKISKIYGVA